MSVIKDGNFFTVQAFMRNELNLKGNELLIYAIIYGFSQIENQFFTGSLNYLAEWTGASRTTIKRTLINLLKKGLLDKETIFKNGVRYCKYRALTEAKKILNDEEIEIDDEEFIEQDFIEENIDLGARAKSDLVGPNLTGGGSKTDLGVGLKRTGGGAKTDPNKIDIIHIYNNHIIEENDFIKIKNWFAENKIDFSKKHQEIILKLLENNSVAYLLKVFQDEINILKNNKDVKNISAIFSYHLFNGTVQIDMKEVEKKETEISSDKNEEIKNSLNLEKTLNIFNGLPEEKQIEIENKILTENNIKYFTKIKNKSKIFYYRLISRFIEQELENIKL